MSDRQRKIKNQLEAVEAKARAVLGFVEKLNRALDIDFPEQRLKDICEALTKISLASHDTVEDSLKYAHARLRAIRVDHVPFDEELGDELSPHSREKGLDRPLLDLIGEITTALDLFERSRDLTPSGMVEAEIEIRADEESAIEQSIEQSLELSREFGITIAQAQSLLNQLDIEAARTVLRTMHSTEILNQLGRSELRGNPTPSWFKRISDRMGGMPGALTIAGDALKVSADLADNINDFLSDQFKAFTNAARNLGDTFQNQSRRMEVRAIERKNWGPPPPFDIDEIKRNLIKGIPPHPAHVGQIEKLDFAFEKDLNDLSAFAGLTALRELRLWRTGVTDAATSDIAKLANLTNLNLDGTQISDAAISDIAKLTNLTNLDLSSTKISDAAISDIAKLTNLTTLYLNDTKISDLAPLQPLIDKGLRVFGGPEKRG